jgi:cytochrome P450
MFTATHHAGDLWPEPEAFRPERHLDGKPVPYSLTPFGGGVRRCIGASLAQLELETVLTEVLAHGLPEPAGARPETPRLSGVSVIPAKGGRIVLSRPRQREREAERLVGQPDAARDDAAAPRHRAPASR